MSRVAPWPHSEVNITYIDIKDQIESVKICILKMKMKAKMAYEL